jgi:hypothetical protein
VLGLILELGDIDVDGLILAEGEIEFTSSGVSLSPVSVVI